MHSRGCLMDDPYIDNTTERGNQMTQDRIIQAARELNADYACPQVCAFNRARAASTEQDRVFWQNVGDFLFKPCPGMAWTDDDIRRWTLIHAA